MILQFDHEYHQHPIRLLPNLKTESEIESEFCHCQ